MILVFQTGKAGSSPAADTTEACAPFIHGASSVVYEERPPTSNFGEWPKVFGGDEKLTTALLDRLAENATIIATKGKSYRMRKRPSSNDSRPTTTAEPATDTPAQKRAGSEQDRIQAPGWISFKAPGGSISDRREHPVGVAR